MKVTTEKNSAVTERARRKAREELHRQMTGMRLSEKISFLKKSFQCKRGTGSNASQKEHIAGTKSFFGRERITNKCQYQETTTLDYKHIIGYCCNECFDLCPLYQFYACSSALMSHKRR